MEVWLHAFSFPGRVARLAMQAEKWGFTGLLVADSQNLNADVWVELALAGAATTRLRVGPGVTNPVTRHLAVTASAAATLQAETTGRAVLALGRGDSAVAQIGRRSVSVAELEASLRALQNYLGGRTAEVDGSRNQLRWLADHRLPKVPLWVAATGPRTIAAAARWADGVEFCVGAEPERLRWAIALARESAPGALSLGAYVNVAVNADVAAARELVRGSVSIFAHFESAPAPGSTPEATGTATVEPTAPREDDSHGLARAPAAQRLPDDFIDRFALVGPARHIAERIRAIHSLGIDRIVVVPGSLDADTGAVAASNRRFARDVLPRLGASA